MTTPLTAALGDQRVAAAPCRAPNLPRFSVLPGEAKRQPASQNAVPIVCVPRSSPSSAPPSGSAARNSAALLGDQRAVLAMPAPAARRRRAGWPRTAGCRRRGSCCPAARRARARADRRSAGSRRASQRAGTAPGTSVAGLSCPRRAPACRDWRWPAPRRRCAPVSGLVQRNGLPPRGLPSSAGRRAIAVEQHRRCRPARRSSSQLTTQPAWSGAAQAGRPIAGRSCSSEIGQPIA